MKNDKKNKKRIQRRANLVSHTIAMPPERQSQPGLWNRNETKIHWLDICWNEHFSTLTILCGTIKGSNNGGWTGFWCASYMCFDKIDKQWLCTLHYTHCHVYHSFNVIFLQFLPAHKWKYALSTSTDIFVTTTSTTTTQAKMSLCWHRQFENWRLVCISYCSITHIPNTHRT